MGSYTLAKPVREYDTSQSILAEVVKALRTKKVEPPRLTVRQFLTWFDAQRRGPNIVAWIDGLMADAGVATSPNYVETYIDDEIEVVLVPEISKPLDETAIEGSTSKDPVLRIGSLKSENSKLVTVSPTDTISHAVTLMMSNDYSQLPVLTSSRDVKGVISWKTIGEGLASGVEGKEVRHFMTSPNIVSHDAAFFQTIPSIINFEYVLIRASDNTLSSIVTTTDLSSQFLQMTEPFLILSEIENHVRILLQSWANLTKEKVGQVCSLPESYSGVYDLSFGDYVRILQSALVPDPFPLNIDRKEFCRIIDDVRETRNEVMHFSADPTPPEAIQRLRKVSDYLRKLQVLAS